MLRYIFRRLLSFIPVLLIIVTVTFFLIRLAPGGPFDTEKDIPPEVKRQIQEHYNLNAPLYRQYIDYLVGLARLDLGPSFKNVGWDVSELIGRSFPISLELGCYALLIALGIGLGAGLLASRRPNTWSDYAPMSVAMIGIGVPNFVLGPLLVLLFALKLQWLPVSGWDMPADKILPSLTLGMAYAAYIARLSRGGMLEVLSQDFIRTARAKGLAEGAVVLKHGLRGGVQPVVTFLGPAAAGLLTGSFVVEKIFFIPGLGSYFIEAALNRDYTMIMGTVLFYAALILLFNLLVDLLQAYLDPRVRLS